MAFFKIGNTGIAFGSTVLAIDLSQGEGPTAALTATRLTGTAPLAVLFDASASTLGDVGTYAFHDLDYSFDFGDPGSGNWSVSGLSKNVQAGGPIASHIFETPGSYTVSVGVVDSLGRSSVAQVTIDVADPATTFAGTDTVAVATDGNFVGAPAGAAQATSLAAVGAMSGKRVLLKRGQSFGALTIPHGSNTVQVGAWGSGAKPQVSSVAIGPGRPTSADFPAEIVVADLDVANGIEQNASGHRMLLLRCDLDDASTSANNMINLGAAIGYWAADDPNRIVPTSSFYWPREMFVVECNVLGSSDGDNTPFGNLYGSGSRWAIMGCDMGGATEHTVRLFAADRMFIGHNRLRGISQAGIRHALKLHSGGFGEYADSYAVSGQTWATSKIVIANNIGGDAADNNDWTFAIRPQNTSSESGEGIEDVIVENCDFRRGFKTNTDVLVVGRRISVRGTTLSGGGSPAISTDSGTTYTNLPPEWRGPYFID